MPKVIIPMIVLLFSGIANARDYQVNCYGERIENVKDNPLDMKPLAYTRLSALANGEVLEFTYDGDQYGLSLQKQGVTDRGEQYSVFLSQLTNGDQQNALVAIGNLAMDKIAFDHYNDYAIATLGINREQETHMVFCTVIK